MSEITYPTRCKIIDIAGAPVVPGHPEIVAATPDVSKPYIGQEGLAELIFGGDMDFGFGNVRITLDNGNIIWGYECWWTPIEEDVRPKYSGFLPGDGGGSGTAAL